RRSRRRPPRPRRCLAKATASSLRRPFSPASPARTGPAARMVSSPATSSTDVASSAFLKRAGQSVRSPRGRGKAKQPDFAPPAPDHTVDLQRKRDQLNARVAELQWDLGGLVYEMAVRDRIQVDVLVRRAAVLQGADSELAEVERILRLEETSTAGECKSC